jgi:hypothetical protein
MFSSRNFIDNVHDVPSSWIFENYLGLSQPLTGQSVRIHSLFNPHDKTPSMYLYYNGDTEAYRYKCFSTGKGGTAVDLMMNMWSVSFAEAAARILEDYTAYRKSGKMCETRIVEHAKWKVSDYQTRMWTKADAEFWSAYNISSDLLDLYNVRPLDRYLMQKNEAQNSEEFIVAGKYIYGYFNKEGQLYKIYQPRNKKQKFIKICDYTQGEDQLEYNQPTLIIASSLKDCLTIRSMGLRAEVIAPDSENTLLSEKLIDELKQMYDYIVTIFDSDEAGVKAMKEYYNKYRLPFCYLPLEKDISDIAKHHGIQKATMELVPVLHRQIAKYNSLQNPANKHVIL